MSKVCSSCKVSKELGEFSRDKSKSDNRTHDCKICRRAKYRVWLRDNKDKVKKIREEYKPYRKEYYSRPEINDRCNEMRVFKEFGLCPEDYRQLREEQKDLCAICGKPETVSRNKRLSVDHCHSTGKVRALLCDRCNRGLGYFKDSMSNLEGALEYLKKYKG